MRTYTIELSDNASKALEEICDYIKLRDAETNISEVVASLVVTEYRKMQKYGLVGERD